LVWDGSAIALHDPADDEIAPHHGEVGLRSACRRSRWRAGRWFRRRSRFTQIDAIRDQSDEDSSPEIQFKEGQRCIEMDLQPTPQMPWLAAPVNHETNLRIKNVKVKIN
jgi:hypothetical protein